MRSSLVSLLIVKLLPQAAALLFVAFSVSVSVGASTPQRCEEIFRPGGPALSEFQGRFSAGYQLFQSDRALFADMEKSIAAEHGVLVSLSRDRNGPLSESDRAFLLRAEANRQTNHDLTAQSEESADLKRLIESQRMFEFDPFATVETLSWRLLRQRARFGAKLGSREWEGFVRIMAANLAKEYGIPSGSAPVALRLLFPLRPFADHPVLDFLNNTEREAVRLRLSLATEQYVASVEKLISSSETSSSASRLEKLDQSLSKWFAEARMSEVFEQHYRRIVDSPPVAAEVFVGQNMQAKMTEILREAQVSIDLETSHLDFEMAQDTLLEKARNGIRVRVILDSRDLKKDEKSRDKVLALISRLEASGIIVSISDGAKMATLAGYWRSLLHRKLIVIDGGRKVFVASANLDKYVTNIESGVILTDAGTEGSRLFASDWDLFAGGPHQQEDIDQTASGVTSRLRLIGRGTQEADLREILVSALRASQKSVLISAYEFSDPVLLHELVAAKRRNPSLDVRVALCGAPIRIWSHGQLVTEPKNKTATSMLPASGIPVTSFLSELDYNHARMVKIDNQLFLGSADLTRLALDGNFELTVGLKLSPTQEFQLRTQFEASLKDFGSSPEPVTPESLETEKKRDAFERWQQLLFTANPWNN